MIVKPETQVLNGLYHYRVILIVIGRKLIQPHGQIFAHVFVFVVCWGI